MFSSSDLLLSSWGNRWEYTVLLAYNAQVSNHTANKTKVFHLFSLNEIKFSLKKISNDFQVVTIETKLIKSFYGKTISDIRQNISNGCSAIIFGFYLNWIFFRFECLCCYSSEYNVQMATTRYFAVMKSRLISILITLKSLHWNCFWLDTMLH